MVEGAHGAILGGGGGTWDNISIVQKQAKSSAYTMRINCIVTNSENYESAIRGIRSATYMWCAL